MSLIKSSLVALSVVLLTTGCSSKEEVINTVTDTVVNSEDTAKISSLQNEIADLQARLKSASNSSSTNSLTPPNAKNGECYSRVLVPAVYGYKTIKIQVKAKGNDVIVTPAQYGYDEKRVTLREESYSTKIIPATYKYVTKKVLVKPEIISYKKVPAKFKIEKVRVKTSESYSTWKKGRGEIEKIDAATGEIMCRIEVPATYTTIERKILASDAKVQKVVTPAVYRTIKTKVLDKPESCVKTKIPAIIKVYKVRKVITEPKVQLVTTGKEAYKTIKTKYLVTDGYLQWKEILCETNTNSKVVSSIQTKLKALKLYNGPIDGIFGSATKIAIKKFQVNNKLSTGALTIDTLKKLGVR